MRRLGFEGNIAGARIIDGHIKNDRRRGQNRRDLPQLIDHILFAAFLRSGQVLLAPRITVLSGWLGIGSRRNGDLSCHEIAFLPVFILNLDSVTDRLLRNHGVGFKNDVDFAKIA